MPPIVVKTRVAPNRFPSSDDIIASAETGTLIGTESIGAVHRQCLIWVIHVCLGLGRTVIHFRFAPKAPVVRPFQSRREWDGPAVLPPPNDTQNQLRAFEEHEELMP